MYYVYELVDPHTGTPRYVGMTRYPELRYQQHVVYSHLNPRIAEWRGEVEAAGLQILIKILETLTEESQAKVIRGKVRHA